MKAEKKTVKPTKFICRFSANKAKFIDIIAIITMFITDFFCRFSAGFSHKDLSNECY